MFSVFRAVGCPSHLRNASISTAVCATFTHSIDSAGMSKGQSLSSLGERGKAAKPADFVDATFVRELDEAGFISDVYQQR